LRLGFLFALCCSMPAMAQDSTARRDSTSPRAEGWIVGPSLGLPTGAGGVSPEVFTVGLNFTRLNPGHPGGDLSFGTMPRALAEGIVAFGFRADVAYPVSVSPRVLLLPAAGLSVIGALSDETGGGTMGLNAGLAAVFHGTSTTGLRIGVTAHQFLMAEQLVYLIELGPVRMPRP
jgi:hypothetical protein